MIDTPNGKLLKTLKYALDEILLKIFCVNVTWINTYFFPNCKIVLKCLQLTLNIKCIHQVDDFLHALMSYDKDHIPESCLTVVKQQYLRNPDFRPDLVWTKSTAAAGLCAWTINIVRYYEVWQRLNISRNDYQWNLFILELAFLIVLSFLLRFIVRLSQNAVHYRKLMQS